MISDVLEMFYVMISGVLEMSPVVISKVFEQDKLFLVNTMTHDGMTRHFQKVFKMG